MDKVEVEILRLAYIRAAQSATLLAQAGEDLLAEEKRTPTELEAPFWSCSP
jgi:hypothetical protein